MSQNDGCGGSCGGCGGSCGCGDQDMAYEKVIISLDGEEDVECSVLGVFEVGEREYIALLPTDDEEVLIFRYTEEDGNISLENIETDAEYTEVAEMFYEVYMSDDEDFNGPVEG